MISLICGIKQNKGTDNIQQTHRYREQVSSYQRGRGLKVAKWIKADSVVMDGNQTCSVDHSVVYTDVDL